jgi:hypothetical protein
MVENELGISTDLSAAERSNYAHQIIDGYRKLFAILIYIRKGPLIFDFIRDQLSDADLPFKIPDMNFGQWKRGMVSGAFENWSFQEMHDFSRVQWYFFAPSFGSATAIRHYVFDDNTVLPFIQNTEKSAEVGGFSSVYKIMIHPAHHRFCESLVSHPSVGN